MTKFLLFCSTFLIVFSLNSQNLNVAEHEAIDEAGGIVSINSKSFYLKLINDDCCTSTLSLTGFDEYDNIIFQKYFGTYDIEKLGKIITSSDKSIVFTTYSMKSCDLDGTKEFLNKVDTNGNILFSTIVYSGTSLYPLITGLTQHSDGTYYMAASGILYHCSASGQLLQNINTGVTSISSVLALNNGNLLLNCSVGGNRKNVIMSTLGTILSQQNSSGTIIKFIQTPSGIYANTNPGLIERYDTNLVYQGNSSVALSTVNYIVNDFTTRNDSLFVTGNYGTLKTPFYAILDASLGLIFQSQSNYEGIRPKGISVNNKNEVNVVSTCNSKPYTTYSFFGRSKFNLNGSFIFDSDIGVLQFSVLSKTLHISNYYTPNINADVIVKNYGQDTVKNFYLNYYAYVNGGSSQCYVLFHQFYQTPIAPTGTISVSTANFYGQPFSSSSVSPSIKTGKWNICLFTTIPNGKNDLNINNDAYCDTVSFLVTGIAENAISSANISVFPNPSTNNFLIKSDEVINAIEIQNLQGGSILKEDVMLKEIEIRKQLASGIYILKVSTKKGILTKKIIRTD